MAECLSCVYCAFHIGFSPEYYTISKDKDCWKALKSTIFVRDIAVEQWLLAYEDQC